VVVLVAVQPVQVQYLAAAQELLVRVITEGATILLRRMPLAVGVVQVL